jgi:serine/threonine protein kinase
MKTKLENPSSLPVNVKWPVKTSTSDGDRLVRAVMMGKPKRIRNLVGSKGLFVDTLSSDGQTPLFCAAYLKKKSVVECLLSLGAEPNIRCMPDGYTAVHGACVAGSVRILNMLIDFGGDLRLMDTKRLSPLDWTEFHQNPKKRKAIRDFVELARFVTMKPVETTNKGIFSILKDNNKSGEEKEARCRIANQRATKSSCFMKWLRSLFSAELRNNGHLRRNVQITYDGFGKIYEGDGIKCGGVIGIPSVMENTDLKYDTDPEIPSWICGKFSTFIPMTWSRRNTSITVKSLRFKSVEEAVSDILIAELDTLVRLQHPRILMLLAICQEQNFSSLSLVFEKITFGSLYFFLHNSNLRMRSSFATDMIHQISEALDFVHGSGYLHCGISSHAIMLVAENQAKLGCFEYAIPENEPNSVPGAPSTRHPWLASDSHLSVLRHWMAPEVLTQSRQASRASDVYSLCSVMWELVLGEVPWKDHTLESMRQLMADSPGLRLPLHKDVIPSHWWSVLSVGLRPNVEDRDLDCAEIRYMMGLAKDKFVSDGGGSLRRDVSSSSRSRVALCPKCTNNNDPNLVPEDLVDSAKAKPSSSSTARIVTKLSEVKFQAPPPGPAVIKHIAEQNDAAQ